MGTSLRKGQRRYAPALLLTGALLMPAGLAWAQTAAPAESSSQVSFSIPPQPLASALSAFIATTGWQVGYSSDLAAGVASPGVSGSFTPQEALSRLLAGTGLTYSATGGGMVVLTRADEGADSGGVVTLDQVIVTAARADRSVRDVPQSVQVISRDEIEQQLEMTSNPAEVLAKLVPGFSPNNQTISGASETFRGRDLLVMIDGVPMNTPLRDVSRILALIDLNTVESIEVVAGASSLYGAGATGGTVNFITRKATAGAPTVSLNSALRMFTHDLGDSLAPEVSASVSGSIERFDYIFTATGDFADKTFDGGGNQLPSDPMLGQGGGDLYSSVDLFGKVGYDIDDSKRIEASATWIYFNQDPDWLTLYSLPYARPDFSQPYPGESVLENTASFSLRYTDSDFALGSLSLLGYYNDVEKRFNYTEFSYPYNSLVYYSGDPADPTAWFNQTTLYSKKAGFNATIDTPLDRILEGLTLTWGTDIVHEKTWQTLINGQDVFTPLQQMTYAGFAQLQVPIGNRVTVRGGLRYEYFDLSVDDYLRPAVYYGYPFPAAPGGYMPFVLPELNVVGGDFGYDAFTFNLGATVKITETAELYGGFSQGFALPDVGAFTRRAGLGFEYLVPGRTVSYSDIAPEAQVVNNYELGLRGSVGRFTGSLAGFISTSDEGVNFDPATNQLTQQKEMIYGVEFIGEYAVNDALTLGTNMTWREGRYDSDDDGKLDAFLPNNRIANPFRGTVYATYIFDSGTLVRLEGEFFSGRNVAEDPTTGEKLKIDGAATMNLAVSQPLFGGFLYAAIDNVFDQQYQNPTATATRNLPVYSWGRTLTVGYRVTF